MLSGGINVTVKGGYLFRMKKLTYDEFQDRLRAVSNARRIFIKSGLTTNITHAFELYQEILVEEEARHAVTVSSAVAGNRQMSPFDELVRPKCDECDTDLRLKLNAKDPDGKKWPTAWVCEKCGAEYYSEKTQHEWIAELKKEADSADRE